MFEGCLLRWSKMTQRTAVTELGIVLHFCNMPQGEDRPSLKQKARRLCGLKDLQTGLCSMLCLDVLHWIRGNSFILSPDRPHIDSLCFLYGGQHAIRLPWQQKGLRWRLRNPVPSETIALLSSLCFVFFFLPSLVFLSTFNPWISRWCYSKGKKKINNVISHTSVSLPLFLYCPASLQILALQ